MTAPQSKADTNSLARRLFEGKEGAPVRARPPRVTECPTAASLAVTTRQPNEASRPRVGSAEEAPDSHASRAFAASRPSEMAQTMRLAPRFASPAQYTPSTEVAKRASTCTAPRGVRR